MQTLSLRKIYKKYPEYKDSDVEWLGKIPNGWNSFKLRNVLRSNVVDGPHETPKYTEEGVPFVSVDSIGENEIVNLDIVKKFISEAQYKEYNKKTKLTENDILFTKAASIGRVAIVDKRKFMTWSPLAIIKPNLNIISHKYLFYVLKSGKFVESVINNCSYNTQLNIGMKVLERSQIGLPKDLDEQIKIAKYLYEKTNFIDQIIEKKKKLIELLKEKRTAIINQAVTKGLNPKAELVDSGIDWIGKIPKGWSVKKLKFFTKISLGKMLQNENKGNDSLQLYLRAQNIQWETVDVSDIKNMWFSKDELLKHRINKNDLLVSEGGEVGRTAIWNNELEECYVQNSINRVTVKESKADSRFVMYEFVALGKKGTFDLIVNKISIGHLTREKLKEIYFVLPLKEEQGKIVDYLDTKTSKIDLAVSHAEKSIEFLQEFKSSLISNVVTGKVKI